ncbi:MAG: LCP family protein [Candidatus Peregrinibacteria bacterium]
MSFRTRPIRKRPPVHPLRTLQHVFDQMKETTNRFHPRSRNIVWGGILLAIGIVVVFKVMMGIYGWVRDFDPQSLLFAAGSDLQQDEHGYTNIVLLGDGGALRDGADLVDTIMVASLDHKNNAVTFFSIPRDFYVNSQYQSRINELYRNYKKSLGDEQSYELFKEVVGKIVNLQIPYYLRVDFTGFVEVVDELGGIDVEVPTTIDDPYYPNPTDDGYDSFYLAAGKQHLDGETALKFVRSRKTTSDYDRAARQQLVLAAMREKALSQKILGSSGTLKSIYGSVKKHLSTNLTLREMLSMAQFAKKADKSRIIQKVIHDDPGQEGGFLYTPDQEFYGGQFVLIPNDDNYGMIHRYTNLIFNKRPMFWDPLKIEILNATKTSGLAGQIAFNLGRYGFDVVNVDNLLDAAGERSFADKSVIRYYDWTADSDGIVTPKNPVYLEALQAFVGAEPIPGDPTLKKRADITIILGADYEAILN